MADLKVTGAAVDRGDEILTPQALAFVADLQETFGRRRDELLARRVERRAEIASTRRLDFLPATKEIREADWTVASAPADLVDRRVEITGPTERKMAINALNSGARVWLEAAKERRASPAVVSGRRTHTSLRGRTTSARVAWLRRSLTPPRASVLAPACG